MKQPTNGYPRYTGRLAPTPSGLLHKGHALTFGTAYYRARHLFAGKLYLRLEDLDVNRCKHEYSDWAIEDLRWLGLDWDSHPDIGDSSGAIGQRDRMQFYKNTLRDWALRGWVYPSEVSRKQLREYSGVQYSKEGEVIFPESLRCDFDKVNESYWNSESCFKTNWRWKVPYGVVTSFKDLRSGDRSYVSGEDFGDFLVWSREGYPSYEMAVVLDDIEAGVTEVVRGEDLLVSTARQLQIYAAMELRAPGFFHCPLVTDEAGVRLAKSSDSESIRSFRDRGYRPEDFWSELGDFGSPEILEWLRAR